jgi:hypothetical protein
MTAYRSSIRCFLVIILCGMSLSAYGKCCGRIDIGAALIDIDVLKSGKTTETLHMTGVKGDATILVYQGLCIKPGFLWASGSGYGEITSGTLAVGYYIPVIEKLKILPHAGVTWGYLSTYVDFKELNLFHLKERFRSSSPFIGIEICYSLTEKWTLTGLYQYAWSRTHTKIKPIVSETSHSCGPNYALGLDYSLNRHWSLTFGVGYNITLSKEKHGLRAKGAKVGIAYYF